jgi:uncharacterized membrane protein
MIWSLIGAVVLGLIVLLVGRLIIHAPFFSLKRETFDPDGASLTD